MIMDFKNIILKKIKHLRKKISHNYNNDTNIRSEDEKWDIEEKNYMIFIINEVSN